ncbi:patatin-like phospholipase family protein [Oceaniglobus ichthyenteri]|uniref:patatin-like phospholipase family protein n=1 Tax=Oceaniglobus ichthyenteri TaxID=2136177 RepID=UPI000D338FA0|nr:patatin-like phospholipase family protein [Oceaniglobus ichthyenteri]
MPNLPVLSAACLVILTGLFGCAAYNTPVNVPNAAPNLSLVDRDLPVPGDDEIWVGLAFSGGGMRASAFAHGMLEGLRAATATPTDTDGILSDVRLVTGVSGGSVTAAHFGYFGAEWVSGYREKFLIKNAEKYMATSPLNPVTLVRGLAGGANGADTFGRFLDETLFHGATFGDLRRKSRIRTWINASDVANNTAFLFSAETFDALCSDLSSYPISQAVSASAAFPLAFAPIVLTAHSDACAYQEPDWLTAARFNPEASSAMKAHARALESYADPDKIRFVKLLDGGITDNFGTTGLSVERARAEVAHSPLSPDEAIKIKRILFLVANAGVSRDFGWTQNLPGPGGVELAMSIANSAMSAASRTGYDAMRLELADWERDLVDYRCALPASAVRRVRGDLAGWDCRDVKLFIGQASFDDLPEAMQTELNAIPTRLRLSVEQVDMAIQAGRLATRKNPELNGFLRSITDGGATLAAAGPARRITPLRN